MLPKKTQNLPRALKLRPWVYEEANKIEFKNKFWFISWLGKSYYINDTIYRDVYITLCNNTHFKFQKNSKTFCVQFREEYTIRLKQGNYYDYLGKFLSSVYNHENIRIKNNVLISRENNGAIINIDNLLGKGRTYYPLNSTEIYGDVACYLVDIDNSKYIIPMNVIQSYFYTLSSMTLYNLIYGVFVPGIVKPYKFEEYAVVAFRSSLISTLEARILSKFYFLNGVEIKKLYQIRRTFLKNLLNNRKNNQEEKAYIDYTLPFKKNVQVEMSLHYHPVDLEENINMVYAISNILLPAYGSLFESDNYILRDDDKVLFIDNEDIVSEGTTLGIQHHYNGQEVSNTPFTNNDAILNVKENDEGPKFYESPSISDALPTKIKNSVSFENSFVRHINMYDEFISSHNSNSETGAINLIYGLSKGKDYMLAILSVFELLEKSAEFKCKYIYLKRQETSKFSYDPFNFQDNGSILLFMIEFNDSCFCIIVRNNKSNRIGIIKRLITGVFDEENDEKLKLGLIKISRDYHYNWSKLKTSKLKIHDFIVVDALNNKERDTLEETVENLHKRILKGIKDSVEK
ncbi:hypothetical protein SAMN05443633_11415 [Chryseobacterium arachidis]|uniref:Uncharacterized protein n=1 Tax=Chryseobacterium arachidis TaxID=1416778 RepID=A0A1M5J647_9FLAO|nr:hypothetical protein [Chryseobacterium arachidis]SHG35835.1 hypothetical protein SAMN05443633_11415 [Chryseobacterium arachidis]